jgi:oxygen-dependent protoporphyrinogen oxidase
LAVRVVIAGGGISGLSLGYALSANSDVDVTVLEAEGRPGGKVHSERAEGFLCEAGVNGFLDNKPKTLELAARLSLNPLRSSDAARKRFVLSGGELHRLPESPPAFLRSGLLSMRGKLRIALEPFIRRGGEEEETLADFARRRLGREAYESFIDPMASGVFAGDPEALSLKSCFPRINELEQEYGSLIRAMLKLMRQRRRKVGAGPGGTLTSFPGGMQSLTDTLKASLGGALRVKTRVASIERTGSGYVLHLSDGTRVDADAAVLAVPSYRGAEVLRELDASLSKLLGEIPYPPLSVVCTGFKERKVGASLDAFGFLIPFKEGRKVLGSLFDSSIFPGRAPEGHVLIRSMVGGARAPALAGLDDGRLLETVMTEMREVLGINAEPDFFRVYRHERAIPQYNAGHGERLRRIQEAVSRHRGLYLTGNAYRGVSLNDCIANSLELADRINQEVV